MPRQKITLKKKIMNGGGKIVTSTQFIDYRDVELMFNEVFTPISSLFGVLRYSKATERENYTPSQSLNF